MINACVSHELRNPLNSIYAQNVQKDALYNEIELLLLDHKELPADQATLDSFMGELDRILILLRKGWRVQNSSAEIMTFIVQDLLDYA